MDRSLSALIARPFGLPAARRASASASPRVRRPGARPSGARPRRAGAPSRRVGGGLPGRLLRPLSTASAAVWGARRARIALISVLVALPLLLGAFVLLRHSSLVAVEHVHVSGVRGPEAQAIDAALVSAARHMSTLDVRTGSLMAAVAPFRVVSDVRVHPQIPHGLRIEVHERLPVAALQVGRGRTAVAADGTVLGQALLSSALPTVGGYRLPAAGHRLNDAGLLGDMVVLGAAPPPLAKLVTRVYNGPEGLTVAMHSGLLAYFGDATRPHAKWLSLARVLADQSSAGASYVDVRLPARPAAGFPAGGGPSSSSGAGEAAEAHGQSESAIAALAAGLSSGSAATGTSTPAEPSSQSSSESSKSGSKESESSSGSATGESSESHSSTGSEAEASPSSPGG